MPALRSRAEPQGQTCYFALGRHHGSFRKYLNARLRTDKHTAVLLSWHLPPVVAGTRDGIVLATGGSTVAFPLLVIEEE